MFSKFDALLRQELAQLHVMAIAFNYSVDLLDDASASPLPMGHSTITIFANVACVVVVSVYP